MRHLIGVEANLETILSLTAPHRAAGAPLDVPALRQALRRHLDALQPDVPRAGGSETAFLTGADATSVLTLAFGEVDDVVPLSGATAADVVSRHRDAVASMDRDEGLAALFQICADSVVSSAGDAAPASTTSGRAVGVLWVNPRPTWNVADLVEAYVHELTHTLLTLDEHRWGHYRSYELLEQPAHFAVSAIRRQARPLNLVFHSVVVAAELLALRAAMPQHVGPFGLHGGTSELTRQADVALASLRQVADLDALTTPRFHELLERVAETLDRSTALTAQA